MTERANGWLKLIGVLVPFVIMGLVGLGALNSRVTTVERQLDTKVEQEVVNVQYDAILRELRTMNDRLERLEAR